MSGIVGRAVTDMLARQFWYDHELRSACSPLFLKDDLGRFWRLYWDDENGLWVLDAWPLENPVAGTVVSGENMQWCDVDVPGKQKLVGARITTFEQADTIEGCVALVRFDNGGTLTVVYDKSSEMRSFRVDS